MISERFGGVPSVIFQSAGFGTGGKCAVQSSQPLQDKPVCGAALMHCFQAQTVCDSSAELAFECQRDEKQCDSVHLFYFFGAQGLSFCLRRL